MLENEQFHFLADASLIKNFNDIGIAVVLKNIYERIRIYRLARADYHRIGIFLDTRCLELGEIIPIFLDVR